MISDKLRHFAVEDPPARQAKARADIEQQVAEYLAKGGKIEQLATKKAVEWEDVERDRYLRERSYNKRKWKNGTGNKG
jgi:predicted TIM-barrel fold metal-dependent hydrolase